MVESALPFNVEAPALSTGPEAGNAILFIVLSNVTRRVQ